MATAPDTPYNAGPPPVTPPNKRRWLWLGGGAALLLCCVGTIAAAVFFGAFGRGTTGGVSGARNATDNYFAAVRDHNWTRAQGYLSNALRPTVSPAALQATWTARETANGGVRDFTIISARATTVNGRNTATIVGTLRYTSGATESKMVNLVKEGSNWRLASLP